MHPIVKQTSTLLQQGNVVGAEKMLATIADTEGDDALIEVMNDIPPKDLLAILREFDDTRESVISMLITPESFAKAILMERLHREPTNERLRGMINAVLHRDSDTTGEFLEAIGELDEGPLVLADYFADRLNAIILYATNGTFEEGSESSESLEEMSPAWLAQQVEVIDEMMAAGDPFDQAISKYTRAEIADRDWQETAWVLLNEYPDIFEQVVIILRDRMVKVLEHGAAPQIQPESKQVTSYDQEESAI